MSTQQQKQFNILLIGEVCTDHFIYGSVDRISPEAPVPIFKVKKEVTFPGMSGNVRKNLIGFDASIYSIHNFESITKSRYVDEKSNQHLIRIDNDNNLQPINLNIERDILPDIYFKPDAVIISDYDKGFLPSNKIPELFNLIRKKYVDCDIFVDSKKKNLSCYKNCFIKINEKEYQKASSTIDSSNKVIITLGKKGAMYKQKTYPTEKVEIFDVSGAGDTFLASFVIKYLETKSIENSIKFANKCAAIVVKKTGTYALTQSDVQELV